MIDNNTEHTLWTEKYRPTNLDTYIGNEHITSKVKIYIENNDIPHLLLHGIQGTGKTTLAKIITNHIDCDTLYINSSDENSVDTIRNKVKNFASTVGFKTLKVIILDEADFITPNGQAALRNLMETFSRTTRFILTCNYIEKIIQPIQSRCQTFGVEPPSKNDVGLHIINILKNENVDFGKQDLITIINANYPDIRKIINTCQLHTVANKLIVDKQSIVEQNYMLKILEILKKGTGSKTKAFMDIRQILADSKVKQYEPLYRFLYDNINEFAPDVKKQAGVILTIAEAQYQNTLVVDQEIGIMAMFVTLINEL